MDANNQRTALALAAVLALAPLTAEATISRAVQFDEKVERAASIIVGRIVSQESRWDANRQRILTYSKIAVEKTLKGSPARELTIVTPGGTVGDIAQDYVGVPRFHTGDENVVFVRETGAGPTVLFFDQGAYRVEKNNAGERMVVPLVSSAVLVDQKRGAAAAPESSRSLSAFEGSVRDSIGRRELNRMRLIEQKKREDASFWNQVNRNKTLVVLALLGAIFATWRLLKR
ncbi:MAG: hypothetical protein M3P06_10815 [Acidobacteriota bacterium]|nr:hypothetical protein [Acidobacteriota bacterium]